VEEAIKAAKEAERLRRKGKDPSKKAASDDKKKTDQDAKATKPRKKLLAIVELSIELNPEKPVEAEADEEK
jgi:hypothetical protein